MLSLRHPGRECWQRTMSYWLLFFWVFVTTAVWGDDSCPAICLDVSQGRRYYGRFAPIGTNTDVRDFYRYKHYSFNGDDIVPLLIDQSLVMIHHDTQTCDLSLVLVHDSKDDSTGGQAHLLVSGNHESPVVQDGPGDGSKSDMYVYRNATHDTELFWEWGWQQGQSKKYRTDGLADGWDASENGGCLTLQAKFIFGIVAWRFVPGPVDTKTGSVDPSDYLYLDMDEVLIICKADDCNNPIGGRDDPRMSSPDGLDQ